MINHNLEQDLQEYCNNIDSQLFEDRLYQPLINLAKSILTKRNIKITDELIADMVSECSIKLPEYYNKNKGTAKNASYILMDQFLLNKLSFENKQKRNKNKVIYIEDIENSDEHISKLIVVEINELEAMKATLLQNRSLFQRLKKKLHRKVALKIIDAIENPNNYKSNKQSFTISIAKHCKVKSTVVYSVIRNMREIMNEIA